MRPRSEGARRRRDAGGTRRWGGGEGEDETRRKTAAKLGDGLYTFGLCRVGRFPLDAVWEASLLGNSSLIWTPPKPKFTQAPGTTQDNRTHSGH